MANKRYDQFTPGTYTPTDIILQADPATGALEKIALQDIPSGNVLHLADVSTANNSGTNPETMATIAVPANTLASNGDLIEIFMHCEFLTAVGSKSIGVNFAAQNLALRTNTNAGVIRMSSQLIRIDATHLRVISLSTNGLTNSNLNGPTLFVFDPTISNNITVTITSGAAADIAYYFTSANVYSI